MSPSELLGLRCITLGQAHLGQTIKHLRLTRSNPLGTLKLLMRYPLVLRLAVVMMRTFLLTGTTTGLSTSSR